MLEGGREGVREGVRTYMFVLVTLQSGLPTTAWLAVPASLTGERLEVSTVHCPLSTVQWPGKTELETLDLSCLTRRLEDSRTTVGDKQCSPGSGPAGE